MPVIKATLTNKERVEQGNVLLNLVTRTLLPSTKDDLSALARLAIYSIV